MYEMNPEEEARKRSSQYRNAYDEDDQGVPSRVQCATH